MQIGLSGLTGKQAPALRCFQCKGTLNLQGFHTLQLVSSPFLLPPSMHSLARQAPPWFTRCSPPPLLLPPPWHGAGLVHGHEAARPGSGRPAAARGLPVPCPTGHGPTGLVPALPGCSADGLFLGCMEAVTQICCWWQEHALVLMSIWKEYFRRCNFDRGSWGIITAPCKASLFAARTWHRAGAEQCIEGMKQHHHRAP